MFTRRINPNSPIGRKENLPDEGPYDVNIKGRKVILKSRTSNQTWEVEITTASDALSLFDFTGTRDDLIRDQDLKKLVALSFDTSWPDKEREEKAWVQWRNSSYMIKLNINIDSDLKYGRDNSSGVAGFVVGFIVKHESVVGERPHYHCYQKMFSGEILSHYTDENNKHGPSTSWNQPSGSLGLSESFIDNFIRQLPS
jgi:hypothetical protein